MEYAENRNYYEKYNDYRKYISPLKTTKCPYFPSCSEYGLEAIQKYGALKGGLLTIWRIIRCNPFSKGGYDPVP